MKFGKEFVSQMVQEWQQAYMDYNFLKKLLKDVWNFRHRNASTSASDLMTPKGTLKRRLSLYRAFSGLTGYHNSLRSSLGKNNEDEVILVSAAQQPEDHDSEGSYQTMFLMSSEEGGEYELVFFRRLDGEFNKVLKFYKAKLNEVKSEADELSKQMDALIALRIKVDNPLMQLNGAYKSTNGRAPPPDSVVHSNNVGKQVVAMSHMDAIQEVEMGSEGISEDQMRTGGRESKSNHQRMRDKSNLNVAEGFAFPELEVLDHVRVNVEPETPVSTLKNVFVSSKSDLSFSKEELKKAEDKIKQAFVQFHQKLRLLKSYCFLNLLAFSKIMKKYDKITSRSASKTYLEMVDNSCLGNSDEITRLTERVEATIIKHFANGNHREGMRLLRPQPYRERHSVTFFLGLFSGCSIALVAAIIVSIHARNLLNSKERGRYMENIFPLYSLFGYIVLHMVLFAVNMYLWRCFRVNYPFIFGFKEFVGYREVLLLASGLSVLTLAAVLSNLDMEMDSGTKSYRTITELVPLGLVTVVLFILFCPFNTIYRSSRFFLIQCSWRCLCAPLYKVTLPDFFLADQLTSQIQAFRSLEFYVCYYGWGDFKRRSNRCQESQVYQIFYIIIAVVPFWARFLQCLRRWLEEGDPVQVLNGLKYFSTIVAVVMRTIYDLRRGTFWKIMAAASSGVTTIGSAYWDIVMDWGLLRRNSKNPWLRDKLLISNKKIYFAAIVINILLRLVWMQLVLDLQEAPFLHRKALVAVVACLEILRRGIWNFFRLENEHLNNVGKYRAFKSVPLPFYHDGEKNR
ncbi:phosphate transporter PHO1 homolog 9 [Coffea arabica]|uniref:Phosphate transporter PHO1 homolog 9 n=1 Tax=Coffea arabica TaxID=13443 RepID=A0ABM4V802_COFAR